MRLRYETLLYLINKDKKRWKHRKKKPINRYPDLISSCITYISLEDTINRRVKHQRLFVTWKWGRVTFTSGETLMFVMHIHAGKMTSTQLFNYKTVK